MKFEQELVARMIKHLAHKFQIEEVVLGVIWVRLEMGEAEVGGAVL